MRRRDLLPLFGSAALLAQTRSGAPAPRRTLIKPKKLSAGDTVALVTPSTETLEPEQLAVATETLVYFGLKPVLMPNVGKRQVNFAESVRNRVADMHEAFRNPLYKGVFCIRGGYGAQQILDQLDYDLIRRNPKVFVGYSDITALHLAIHKRTGLVTLHGPVPLSAFSGYTQEHFKQAIFGSGPLGELDNPRESNTLRPAHHLRTITPGVARGPLMGGNLSLIVGTMGTPYEIDTRGTILFLEDVGEQVYALDRMLMNLRLAKKLQQAAGIIWGECFDCPPRDEKTSTASAYGLSETAQNLLGDLGIPVLSGLVIGHTHDQLTLPLGITAELDATKKVVNLVEPHFSEAS